jgi:hypothetical protein
MMTEPPPVPEMYEPIRRAISRNVQEHGAGARLPVLPTKNSSTYISGKMLNAEKLRWNRLSIRRSNRKRSSRLAGIANRVWSAHELLEEAA